MADKQPPLSKRIGSFVLSNLDSVFTALKYLLPSTVVGVVVGWSVAVTDLFKSAAPASYIAAGLLAWFLTVLGIWLLSLARSRNQITKFRENIFNYSRINPLAPRFVTERIRMVDLSPPIGGIISKKTFEDCEIIGPASVMFHGCHFRGCGGSGVDALIVKTGVYPRNGFGFEDCTFINCRFYLTTFMIPEPVYPDFAVWNWNGLNWLTDLPSPPLPEVTTRPEADDAATATPQPHT